MWFHLCRIRKGGKSFLKHSPLRRLSPQNDEQLLQGLLLPVFLINNILLLSQGCCPVSRFFLVQEEYFQQNSAESSLPQQFPGSASVLYHIRGPTWPEL